MWGVTKASGSIDLSRGVLQRPQGLQIYLMGCYKGLRIYRSISWGVTKASGSIDLSPTRQCTMLFIFNIYCKINCATFVHPYQSKCYLFFLQGIWNICMVRVTIFKATFNNISVIPWRSVLLVEETEVPGKKHRLVASH